MTQTTDTEIRVVMLPGGNGVHKPYAVLVGGQYLRTKIGVARRFKTISAADQAARTALSASPAQGDGK